MAIELRIPTEDDWAEVTRVDGQNFGSSYDEEATARARRLVDLSRFRVVTDGPEIVGVAGSYALDVAVPGGAAVPTGGVTWVSVSVTHRRQGLLTRLLDAVHRDVEDRGEPVASLYASEGGIYERFGYGMATQIRSVTIEARRAQIRPELRPEPGAVRFAAPDEAASAMASRWERWWRERAGEVRRSDLHRDLLAERVTRPLGPWTAAHVLLHEDGYLAYRMRQDWDRGHPKHEVDVIEHAATTAAARAALWHTLLSIDLVGSVTSRQLALDDPLPYLLDDQRLVRTNDLNDGVWALVLDVPLAFGARTYATSDRLVVETERGRWSIDGSPEGGEVKAVRSRPDLTLSHAALGALLYGGVRPSALVDPLAPPSRRRQVREESAAEREQMVELLGRDLAAGRDQQMVAVELYVDRASLALPKEEVDQLSIEERSGEVLVGGRHPVHLVERCVPDDDGGHTEMFGQPAGQAPAGDRAPWRAERQRVHCAGLPGRRARALGAESRSDRVVVIEHGGPRVLRVTHPVADLASVPEVEHREGEGRQVLTLRRERESRGHRRRGGRLRSLLHRDDAISERGDRCDDQQDGQDQQFHDDVLLDRCRTPVPGGPASSGPTAAVTGPVVR